MECNTSFEFYPPKTEAGREKLLNVTAPALQALGPEFFSCTYGAGRGDGFVTFSSLSQLGAVAPPCLFREVGPAYPDHLKGAVFGAVVNNALSQHRADTIEALQVGDRGNVDAHAVGCPRGRMSRLVGHDDPRSISDGRGEIHCTQGCFRGGPTGGSDRIGDPGAGLERHESRPMNCPGHVHRDAAVRGRRLIQHRWRLRCRGPCKSAKSDDRRCDRACDCQ